MFLLILVVFSLTIAWKYGDWRHWKLYYATSLYWIIGDITCSYLTYNKPLWTYHSAYLSHTRLVNNCGSLSLLSFGFHSLLPQKWIQ